MLILVRLLTFSIVFTMLTLTAFADITMTSFKTDKTPVVDGVADSLWSSIKPVVVKDPVVGSVIELKSVHTEEMIFFIVKYNDDTEERFHRRMVWDKEKERYVNGREREDAVVFKWNMMPYKVDLTLKGAKPYNADVWFWKADRTDPTGFADDKMQIYSATKLKESKTLLNSMGNIFYLVRKGDKGSAAYSSALYPEFIEERMPKYNHQQASGSRGDVRAKGVWKDGYWTVEFSRQLDTGNSDDLSMTIGETYDFGISTTEIAGRDPEPEAESDKTYYGTGEIGELISITLK